jgi:hypothetical protein
MYKNNSARLYLSTYARPYTTAKGPNWLALAMFLVYGFKIVSDL